MVDIPEFEVLFESGVGSSEEEAFGVIIETPAEVDQAVLKLNELLLEARGGTSLVWRGDILADVNALENADNTTENSLKRRPERWNLTIASGIVKSRVSQSETTTASTMLAPRRPLLSFGSMFRNRFSTLHSPTHQITLADFSAPMVMPAGVASGFDPAVGLELEPVSAEVSFLSAGVVDTDPFNPTVPFSESQLEQLSDSQPLLNLMPDLASAQAVAQILIPPSQSLDENVPPNPTLPSLLDVILSSGVSSNDLGTLLQADPMSSALITNSIMSSPDGFSGLQALASTFADPVALGTLFASLAGSDPAAVDLFLIAASASDALTSQLNTLVQANPELAGAMIERLSSSPAALETVVDQASASPNALVALSSLASVDDSPVSLGASLLLTVVQSSPQALANFTLAVESNPDMLANVQSIADSVQGFTSVLSAVGVDTADFSPPPLVVNVPIVEQPIGVIPAEPPVEVVEVPVVVPEPPQATSAPVVEEPSVPNTSTPVSPSSTFTPAATDTPTYTPTETYTPSNTSTPTPTYTPTYTPSNTPTSTPTPTATSNVLPTTTAYSVTGVTKYAFGGDSFISITFNQALYINSVVSYICAGSPVTLNFINRFGAGGVNNYHEIFFIGSAPISNSCMLTLSISSSSGATAYSVTHTQ